MRRVSHVHYSVEDLPAAVRWFREILLVTPAFETEWMAWLRFGDFGVILDAASTNSLGTLGLDSNDCDADYAEIVARGATPIEPPTDRPWGARVAYLKGPADLIVEIEQPLKQ